MNPVKREELSALLDGELGRRRAREVRASLAADPVLAAEFDVLSGIDGRLREAAAAMAFDPLVRLHERSASSDCPIVSLSVSVMVLLLMRILGRAIDTAAVTWGLNAAALVVVLAAAWWLVRPGWARPAPGTQEAG